MFLFCNFAPNTPPVAETVFWLKRTTGNGKIAPDGMDFAYLFFYLKKYYAEA